MLRCKDRGSAHQRFNWVTDVWRLGSRYKALLSFVLRRRETVRNQNSMMKVGELGGGLRVRLKCAIKKKKSKSVNREGKR